MENYWKTKNNISIINNIFLGLCHKISFRVNFTNHLQYLRFNILREYFFKSPDVTQTSKFWIPNSVDGECWSVQKRWWRTTPSHGYTLKKYVWTNWNSDLSRHCCGDFSSLKHPFFGVTWAALVVTCRYQIVNSKFPTRRKWAWLKPWRLRLKHL